MEKNLIVNEIKTFCGKNFDIYHNGKLFYSNQTGEKINFNLPKGRYFIECDTMYPIDKKLVYITPKIEHLREKFIKMKPIKINIVENRNKASISVADGNIFFDEKIHSEWATPKKVFILGHELGHNYFKSEDLCDLFSAKKMLENGFNLSQCYYSSVKCLKNNPSRNETLLNFLKNTKIKYE
jgi:hypothetical protein